jgi:hypothetical protein
MKTKQIKIFIQALALLAAVNILPLSALAATTPDARCQTFKDQFKVSSGVNIVSDLPQYCSATQLILAVINFALGLSGVVTILFLVVGGFWYITSAGNEEQTEKGKKTIINAIIGLIVIILSYTIVRIVGTTLTLNR